MPAGTSIFISIICYLVFMTPTGSFCSTHGNFKSDSAATPSENEEARKLLVELIRYESVSGDEKQVGQFLLEWCQSRGLYIRVFGDTSCSFNFSASLYPLKTGKKNIILMSHLDVVPDYEPQDWKFPPFAGSVYRDTVYGRGSIDCKGLAVMQLMALLRVKNSLAGKEVPYNLTFLAVSNEETSAYPGAGYLTERHMDELNPAVVFGEGGSGVTEIIPSRPELPVFCVSVAEKSSLWLKITIEEKAHGHGAIPPDLYANKKLTKVLIKLLDAKRKTYFSSLTRQMFRDLGKAEGGFKGFVLKHINWSIFWPFVKNRFREGRIFDVFVHNTFVITEISSLQTGAVNKINNKAYAILDCRLLPGTGKEKFIRRIRRTIGKKGTIEVLSESPNAMPSDTTGFYHYMKEAVNKVYPDGLCMTALTPASSDNNYFRVKNVPVFGFLPVVLSREELQGIHGINEFIPLKSVMQGIEFYEILLNKLEGAPIK